MSESTTQKTGRKTRVKTSKTHSVAAVPLAIRRQVSQMFQKAAFVQNLGIELTSIGSGICQSRLKLRPSHLQQTGVAHAGVLATLADHTAGAAATSLLTPEEYVLTAEFKINLLRPAKSKTLVCTSKVIKSGRTLSFVESEVFDFTNKKSMLVAKCYVTLAVLRRPPHQPTP